MIEKYVGQNYDDGYYYGWEQGNRAGLKEGFDVAAKEYEYVLAKYVMELEILNARISYLERLTGGTNG